MDSNYNKNSSGSSLNNFNFDLGLNSSKPKSLNGQKTQTSKPTWQPGKPSWSHQPAPGQSGLTGRSDLNGPSSMVGDIFGKSWNLTGASSGSGIGIAQKNPNLFGDLVSSALGQGKSGSNVPLKNAAGKSNFNMGNVVDSLPKTGNSGRNDGSLGGNRGFGGYSAGYTQGSSSFNVSGGGSSSGSNKSVNLGSPSMKSMSGSGMGGGIGGSKDPFGSLVDFGSKQQPGSVNSAGKASNAARPVDDAFGDFQNASKSSNVASKPSVNSVPLSGFDAFGSDFTGSNVSSNSGFDGFGNGNQKQPAAQSSGNDPIDILFSSSGGAATGSAGGGAQQFNEVDDWGIGSECGGGGDDAGGATTELEGLPPPPAGVTASVAKNKGMDSQKQGQYADAIKWLSWAVVLIEKTGDKASIVEVLSCRASCYKEVGEYKKAVADCSKVLEDNDKNVAALLQRALLYESMEKYKLGAEDLRTVLKIDPINRVARSTIHRLTQMAD